MRQAQHDAVRDVARPDAVPLRTGHQGLVGPHVEEHFLQGQIPERIHQRLPGAVLRQGADILRQAPLAGFGGRGAAGVEQQLDFVDAIAVGVQQLVLRAGGEVIEVPPQRLGAARHEHALEVGRIDSLLVIGFVVPLLLESRPHRPQIEAQFQVGIGLQKRSVLHYHFLLEELAEGDERRVHPAIFRE